jgi:hypothetical protein
MDLGDPKVVARTRGKDESLRELLEQRGLVVRVLRDCFIIQLAAKNDNGKIVYELPHEISAATLLINATESGGRNRRYEGRVSATVVCGLSGKRLWPYRTHDRTHCGIHAFFNVVGGVVTVTSRAYMHGRPWIEIVQHNIVQNGNIVTLESETRWQGTFDGNLPHTSWHYRYAVEAAIAKSRCINCNDVHFADLTKELQEKNNLFAFSNRMIC